MITTRHGARAILQSPCEVVIVSDSELRLFRGKLVGNCPTQQSKGFAIDTPGGQIVDVGTEFGVSVEPDGRVGVRVFTGIVEVETGSDRASKQSLVTGDLARIASGRLDRVAFDASLDFQTKLPVRALIPQLTGQVRWLSSPPLSIRKHDFEDADNAYLFLEQRDVILREGTKVNAIGPGLVTATSSYRSIKVPNDQRVDSYMLHFDPPAERDGKASTFQCTIVFDRPIVGLVSYYLRLKSTDVQFAHPDIDYEDTTTTREIQEGTVEISPDGRSLVIEFDIDALGGTRNHLRVLVASR